MRKFQNPLINCLSEFARKRGVVAPKLHMEFCRLITNTLQEGSYDLIEDALQWEKSRGFVFLGQPSILSLAAQLATGARLLLFPTLVLTRNRNIDRDFKSSRVLWFERSVDETVARSLFMENASELPSVKIMALPVLFQPYTVTDLWSVGDGLDQLNILRDMVSHKADGYALARVILSEMEDIPVQPEWDIERIPTEPNEEVLMGIWGLIPVLLTGLRKDLHVAGDPKSALTSAAEADLYDRVMLDARDGTFPPLVLEKFATAVKASFFERHKALTAVEVYDPVDRFNGDVVLQSRLERITARAAARMQPGSKIPWDLT